MILPRHNHHNCMHRPNKQARALQWGLQTCQDPIRAISQLLHTCHLLSGGKPTASALQSQLSGNDCPVLVCQPNVLSLLREKPPWWLGLQPTDPCATAVGREPCSTSVLNHWKSVTSQLSNCYCNQDLHKSKFHNALLLHAST